LDDEIKDQNHLFMYIYLNCVHQYRNVNNDHAIVLLCQYINVSEQNLLTDMNYKLELWIFNDV
jgi:hypothetical protein